MLRETWTLAIETLSWMELQKLSERLALARTIRQLGIENGDAIRLAHSLICETVGRQNFIDAFINHVLAPKKIREYNLGLQSFLRLYVYQTRIARNWSQINLEEAESIAKTVRSVLGWKTLQEVEHILGLLLTQEPKVILDNVSDERRIGLTFFHPTWFVKYCFRLFGRSATIAMLEANMKTPPTYIRLNTLKSEETNILAKLTEEGVTVKKVDPLKYAYEVVSTRIPLAKTSSFREGLFYVQDKASCFAAEVASPKPGMTVLDICAAPGAKTTYLAQLMQNRGFLYSFDYSKRRMSVWKNEVDHAGAEIAHPIIADARGPFPIVGEADLIVLDPPCTSTGTFRKVPSAKWRLTQHSIDRMADIQLTMLNSCSEYVKNNGTLVYSTCSITVEENEMLIEQFLKHHADFSLAEVAPKIGLPGLRGLDKCQRLYPHIHSSNGFFIAKMLRE